MIHHIENEQILSEVINSEKLVIVDFFAEWCGPCQMLTPILKNLEQKYTDSIEVYKVDVDESQAAAMRYGITAMPTLLFFKDNQEIDVKNIPVKSVEDFIMVILGTVKADSRYSFYNFVRPEQVERITKDDKYDMPNYSYVKKGE